jgi:putative hydrolase of HD superfamily
VATDGGTWVAPQVSEEQVFARYGPTIESGAPALWQVAVQLVREHFSDPLAGKADLDGRV